MYFEMIKDLQVKQNKTRIWLEGNILKRCNLKFNDTYDLFISKNVITLIFQEYGSKKISGNIKRPIIDISNKKITSFFNNCSKFKFKFISCNSNKRKSNCDLIELIRI